MTRFSAERIAAIEARKEELQQAMSAPDLAPDAFVQLSKDYAEILPVAEAARELRRLRAEIEVLDEMLADPSPDIR
ncbi:MAG: peptide chain release factor 1, partial [Sphingomonadales bacterium]|nr:peptide chain release factor 1 [Sphingomonadales bacterium]